MNKINIIIIYLLIFLTLAALAIQSTLIALQIINNNFAPFNINQLSFSIPDITSSCANNLNYADHKLINHITYLKITTYSIIIGSILNLINLVLLLVYFKILKNANEETYKNHIKKLKFLNILFSFIGAIPLINYCGYMLSFNLDMKKLACSNIDKFNKLGLTDLYLKLSILSGVMIFLCLNQFWLGLCIRTPKQIKYLTKDQQGNTLQNLNENIEQTINIRSNLVTKHNIYDRKNEQKKLQKIEQKVNQNNNANNTQQNLIVPVNQLNILSNIKINQIIQSNVKKSKSHKSQHSSIHSHVELIEKNTYINKQNQEKQNIQNETIKQVMPLQKQVKKTPLQQIKLNENQDGLSPLQQSQEIFKKSSKKKKKINN